MASRDLTSGSRRRLVTETKQAFKTTEFWAFVVVAVAVLIAADHLGAGNGNDVFRADRAWLYVTILAAAYMISRGLAKAGSREPYSDAATGNGNGLGERVAKAAAVLREGDVPDQGGSSAGESSPVGARAVGSSLPHDHR